MTIPCLNFCLVVLTLNIDRRFDFKFPGVWILNLLRRYSYELGHLYTFLFAVSVSN